MEVYILDKTEIPTEQIEYWYNDIDPIKKHKIDATNNIDVKVSRIVSDHLVRHAVSKFLGIKAVEVSFCYGKHGKPMLTSGNAHFNATHSGDFVAVCVDNYPCGIDIEAIREVNIKSSKMFCTDDEFDYINNSDDKSKALLEIWTKKEAYFKSFGCGIATCLTAVNTLKTKGFKTYTTPQYILTIYSDYDTDINFK